MNENADKTSKERMWDTVAYHLVPFAWICETDMEDESKLSVEDRLRIVHESVLVNRVHVRVRFDGLFVFDFSRAGSFSSSTLSDQPNHDVEEQIMARRVQILNAHLACLYTACFRAPDPMRAKMTLTHSSLILSPSIDLPYVSFSDATTALSFLTQRPSTYTKVSEAVPEIRVEPNTMRHRVSVRAVVESLEMLDEIIYNNKQGVVAIADLLLQSCASLEQGNYNRSLVLSWAITEKYMTSMWDGYMSYLDDKKRPDKEYQNMVKARTRMLKEGRTPNFRDMIAFLIAESVIPLSLQTNLERVQHIRDEWLHRLEPIPRTDAVEALFLAQDVLRLVEDVFFKVNPFIQTVYGPTSTMAFYANEIVDKDHPLTVVIPKQTGTIVSAPLHVEPKSVLMRKAFPS